MARGACQGAADDIAYVDIVRTWLDRAGFEPCHIQQVGNEPVETLGFLLDGPDQLFLRCVVEVRIGNATRKGYLYDERQAGAGTPLNDCRVDASGAINTAVYGQPQYPAIDERWEAVQARAEDALCRHLGVKTAALEEWGDAKGRQKRTVVKALRDAAASLRKEATA